MLRSGATLERRSAFDAATLPGGPSLEEPEYGALTHTGAWLASLRAGTLTPPAGESGPGGTRDETGPGEADSMDESRVPLLTLPSRVRRQAMVGQHGAR